MHNASQKHEYMCVFLIRETLITIDLFVSPGNLIMTMDFTLLCYLLQGYIIPLFRIRRFTFVLHTHFAFIGFYFISFYFMLYIISLYCSRTLAS